MSDKVTVPLWLVYLPVMTNDGKPQPANKHEEAETAMLDIAGGFTVSGAECQGTWQHGGKTYTEPMYEYRIMCTEPQIRQIVDRLHAIYNDQLALFVAKIGEAWLDWRPNEKE